MSDTNIYCTYLTIYRGNKLPPFYIGSSTVLKIESRIYHGSVKSKKYKSIWENELKENPNLFMSYIITRHKTREEATERELRFHRALKVVKSPMYINMSLATKNGFFGRDVSGTNNPFYGKKHTKESIDKFINSSRLSKKEQAKKCSVTKIEKYSKLAEYIDPNGIVYHHKGIITFCEIHGLSYACMRKVLERKNKTHRGWRARYI